MIVGLPRSTGSLFLKLAFSSDGMISNVRFPNYRHCTRVSAQEVAVLLRDLGVNAR